MLIQNLPFPVSPACTTARDNYNAEWDHLADLRTKAQAEIDRLAAIPGREITTKTIDARRKAKLALIEVIKAEIAFLEKFHQEWDFIWSKERADFAAKAEKSHVDTEAEVTAQLVAIGYPLAQDGAGYITPDRYARLNPRVRSARAAVEDVGNLSPSWTAVTVGKDTAGREAEINILAAQL